MTDDQLRQLLQPADASAPRSAAPGEVARRVRIRARRRRTARSAAMAAFVLATAAGAALRLARLPADRQQLAKDGQTVHRNDPAPGPASTPAPNVAVVVDAAALRLENAQLESEVRLHLMTAEAMLRREADAARTTAAARATERTAGRPDPLLEIAAG